MDLGIIRSELDVKVLAVRAGAHGGTENGLNQEAVVRLECLAVCATERISKLLSGLGDILAKCDAGELKTTIPLRGTVSISTILFRLVSMILLLSMSNVPDQPQKALGGSVLLYLQLVSAKILDVLRLGRRSELAITDFLYRARRSAQLRDLAGDGRVSRLTLTLPSMSDLTGEKAIDPRTSTFNKLASWARNCLVKVRVC